MVSLANRKAEFLLWNQIENDGNASPRLYEKRVQTKRLLLFHTINLVSLLQLPNMGQLCPTSYCHSIPLPLTNLHSNSNAPNTAPYALAYFDRQLPTFQPLINQPHTNYKLLSSQPANLAPIHKRPHLL